MVGRMRDAQLCVPLGLDCQIQALDRSDGQSEGFGLQPMWARKPRPYDIGSR
jgi:hypothetical protein